jgi:ABC-type sugar transport system, periplasmic component
MKKKMKLVSIVMVVAMLTTMSLAGCSKAGGGNEATIEWWTPNWNEDASREMADEFMAEHPEIKVELVITDWETYRSRITTAISGDNAPELFTVLLTDIKPLADLGLLASLNELGKDAGIEYSDFIVPALDITTVRGDIYGIPFRYDGSGIFYNVDILEAAGYNSFPETWDDMIVMAEALQAAGMTAFAWPLGNQAEAVTRFIQQLYTFGGEILNEDESEAMLNTEAAKRALANIVDSIESGYASPNSLELNNTNMRNMFGSGQLAFNFTGPFDIDVLAEEYPDLNFSTAVIPGNNGMGVTTANGWCVGMAENSVNKEAAALFLAYITNPDNQVRLTDSFPASKTAIEFEQYTTEKLKPFAEQLANSVAEPTYTRWAEIEPIMFQHIQAAVSGSVTVDEAIENMNNDLNILLAS